MQKGKQLTQSDLQKILNRVKFNQKEKFPVACKIHNRAESYKEIWIDCSNNVKRSITISSHIRACKEFNNYLSEHDAVCGLYISVIGVHRLQVRF
ncbi:hypothetical protein CG709_20565 [Lachnotalea glycerini]|nr:hypothetical protein CG709_20565 [Lachnotalea glycerini]